MFQICKYPCHHLSGSIYPKDQVPSELFQDAYGVGVYVRCIDCRKHARASKKKTISKRKNTPLTEDEVHCKSCGNPVKKDGIVNGINKCASCKQNEINQTKKRPNNLARVLQEKIVSMDHCCDVCRKNFIRAEGPRFVEREECLSTLNIDINTIEYDNLKFKYLNGGNIAKGILNLRSYSAIAAEAKKCQVICLLCNAKVKMHAFQKYRDNNNIEHKLNEKQLYVNSIKISIHKCAICDFFDETCLSYFDFDHIDPAEKTFNIGLATKTDRSLDEIKKEVPKCRLLCKFCHRKVTKGQITSGVITAVKQLKKQKV